MIFIGRIALLKYRLKLPGFELPTPIQVAQREFDIGQAAALEAIADRITGEAERTVELRKDLFHDLQEFLRRYYPFTPTERLPSQLRTFCLLSERVDALIRSLSQDV